MYNIETQIALVKRNYIMGTRTWYGPALNSPGHKLHGAKPVMIDGKHSGWLMPTLPDSRQQPKSLAHRLTENNVLQKRLDRAQRQVNVLMAMIAEGQAPVTV